MKPFLLLLLFLPVMALSEGPLTVPFLFLNRTWADCVTSWSCSVSLNLFEVLALPFSPSQNLEC